MTTLLVLLTAWFAVSTVLAFAIGAFIKAGHGPHLEEPLQLLPGLREDSTAERGPRADASPLEDLAA